MNVALCSIFRNSVDYVDRYYAQVAALADAQALRGDSLRLILAEGDSVDNTWRLLHDRKPAGLDVEIIKRGHGGVSYGSTLDPRRLAQLAYVANGVLERVRDDDDAVIYVESDLIWTAETMLHLLGHVGDIFDIVAPMAMHHNGRFYDTWAYRASGQNFGFYPPFHPDLATDGDDEKPAMTQLDSAGSCLVMTGDVARTCRFPAADCIVGFCREAREMGCLVWLDTRVAVVHPPDGTEDSIPGVREAVGA